MDDLLQLNPDLDRTALAAQFQTTGRLQIREALTARSAAGLRSILARDTPWGLAWQAGATAPAKLIRSEQLAAISPTEREAMARRAAEDPDYAFAYQSYPLVTAYLERWRPGSSHDRLLEELNSPPFLTFMRAITGIDEIVKVDGQATLYGPGHFLRPHTDQESERGRRVAYVLNVTDGEWQPEWGGNLNFLDEAGEVEQAFQPCFNSLNLFRVPQWHCVGEVSAAAPFARYAVTGWARDR